jgi:hypothetical protein
MESLKGQYPKLLSVRAQVMRREGALWNLKAAGDSRDQALAG